MLYEVITYNNTVTGDSGFVYPEFKGFYSRINWLKLNGKNNNGFTVYCHSDLTFLRMLTPIQPADPGKGALVTGFPTGDISFVKNIPAMGTKFMEAVESGPQGKNKTYFGNVDEPIVITSYSIHYTKLYELRGVHRVRQKLLHK